LALLVGLALERDAAERERPRNRLERGLADGDADHQIRSKGFWRSAVALASIKASCSPRPACTLIGIVAVVPIRVFVSSSY
jgi:hypothetical protein